MTLARRAAIAKASADLAVAEQLVESARLRLVELEAECTASPSAANTARLEAVRTAFTERAQKIAAWRCRIEVAQRALGGCNG